ncbi:MAG: Alkanesulfonate monooxygenase [Bacteroidetes bacterium]|nr:Alkanesulfonate monooxygenase [Bacteroidota bacterium]
MKLNLPDRIIDVFTISPRTTDQEKYWQNIKDTIALSEKYSYSGNLVFTGNDIYVDPWLVANTIFNDTKSLSPLVAANPLYLHPFSAAKMISSFAYIYKRKTYVNCVTGTSKNDLFSFNDTLDHDSRYDRLKEYIELIKLLLSGEPVTYNGRYYTITNMQLLPKMPAELLPEFYIAGASEPAMRVAEQISAVHMVMGQPLVSVPVDYPPDLKQKGVYLGLITRKNAADAWKAVLDIFPDNKEGELMLEYSMNNTDSVWKQKLLGSADTKTDDARYWMAPFKSFQADCPYYIGDYFQIADVIVSYVMDGARSIIIDTPADEQEYQNIQQAFKIAEEKLIISYNQYMSKDTLEVKFNF